MLVQKFKSEVAETRFSRKRRLSNPNEFKAVFQAAKKLYSRNFALQFKKNDLNYSRLGIIVAKRNVRRAVTRNLIKRMVRESFRFNQSRLCGTDVIVVVYHAFSLLSRQEIHKVLDEQWRKLASFKQPAGLSNATDEKTVIANTGCTRQSSKNDGENKSFSASDSLEQPKS